MQGLILKYQRELAEVKTVLYFEENKFTNLGASALAGMRTKDIMFLQFLSELGELETAVGKALDTSAAKLRRVEAGRLTWQARAERLQGQLNDANAQIEDLQDALDYSAPDFVEVGEGPAVYGQNPPATADAPQRNESDGGAGEGLTAGRILNEIRRVGQEVSSLHSIMGAWQDAALTRRREGNE